MNQFKLLKNVSMYCIRINISQFAHYNEYNSYNNSVKIV